jgi:Zn-dependent protease with chaperone function
MDNKDYELLVLRLEGSSGQNPASFRLRVMLISGLAYAALFLFLAALGLLVYFLFQVVRDGHNAGNLIKIGLFALTLVPVFWVTLRAFLTRLEPPSGRELTREEAPRLFDVLDRIRAKLKAPPLYKVLVDDQYNAAICQVPRFGLFGGHRNYLIVGLPYMLGTPARETIAALAHEYGHLSGDHGKVGAWVYRQRRTFGALHAKVAEDAEGNVINGLIADALDRFAPYFNAYTFVLSRQQEYEADAAASRIAGVEANASGLIRDELLGRWIAEGFWPRLYAQAGEVAKPRFMPYAAMRTAFAAAHGEWATQERLKEALKKDSGLEDTHPCLRERLDAVGGKETLPAVPEHSAAESLLGPTAKRLIEEFDRSWWEENRGSWQSHYQRQVSPRPLATA